MTSHTEKVFPAERAGSLETIFRRLIHNPDRLLDLYVKSGMVVLDVGCGPGYFTLPIARMVGPNGTVIAADLQQGMLDRLQRKIAGSNMEKIIELHKTTEASLGITRKVDFALAFYVVHEVSDQKNFFQEIGATVNRGGTVLIVEPNFRVSEEAFRETLKTAAMSGLTMVERKNVFLSKAALLRHVSGTEEKSIDKTV